MSLLYPVQADTVKTINEFSYNIYFDTFINMLKYNNDSSTTIRTLSAFLDSSRDVRKDLIYKTRFDMRNIDFVTIDRFNGFLLDKIPNHLIDYVGGDIVSKDTIIGYSKYTQGEYVLKEVRNQKDFIRHSFPCDCFFTSATASGSNEYFSLPPNVKVDVDIKCLDSAITIRPDRGLDQKYLTGKNITLSIEGISLSGDYVREDILIDSYIDYNTFNTFTLITSLELIGTQTSVSFVIIPYISGKLGEWEDVFDKETNTAYRSTIIVDTIGKAININISRSDTLEFPILNETFKIIKLDIPKDEIIIDYFIDTSNKLLYTVTSNSILYCFPLIMPLRINKDIDKLKTDYQSMRIEYYDNSVTEDVTFYVFPSHKTNDVESLSVFVNGKEVISDILLDLYRKNIETNRIVIPYSDLYKDNSDDALVEFMTYGIDLCSCPIYLSNAKLKPIYKKDLTLIKPFTLQESQLYIDAYMTSRSRDYKESKTDILDNGDFVLSKVSTKGNVLVNWHEIVNVFDTFNYDLNTGTIVTSDTITNIKSNSITFFETELGEIIVDNDGDSFTIA